MGESMSIKALIFDFDGLILDTETPEFRVWQAIYREHGQQLDPADWGRIVGGAGAGNFDAASHLAKLVGDGLDPAALRERNQTESDRLILSQPILPGVVEYLEEARRIGLGLAIASSSPHSWVDAHLRRLQLSEYFKPVVCADDVPVGRTKPHPDLFLKALNVLTIEPGEALAFEDSPNGARAAHAAGIFVVTVPNPITALLRFEGEDLRLESLAGLPLESLLARL